jgi:hypothetical protein
VPPSRTRHVLAMPRLRRFVPDRHARRARGGGACCVRPAAPATIGRRLCCKRRRRLLRPASDAATSGGGVCYVHLATVLPATPVRFLSGAGR